MTYTAFELASCLYQKATKDKIKLHKLLYISFGFYGALNNGKHLFAETINAWPYGPVIPNVYHQHNSLKQQPTVALDPKTKRTLDHVIAIYGTKKPFDLVNLTHQKGSPWSQSYVPQKYVEIDKSLIIDHYRVILDASIVLLSSDSRRIMEDFATS